MKNFGDINIVTGGNGSGKSTILEALFLNAGGGNPALAITLNGLRGDDELSHENDLVFHSIFYNFDAKEEISINANFINPNDKLYTRNLKITPRLKQKQSMDETGIDVFLNGLDFKFSNKLVNSKKEKISKNFIYFGDDVIKNPFEKSNVNTKDIVSCRFISPLTPAIRDISGRITSIIMDKQDDSIVNILKEIDPRITKITTISEKGRNQIYVDINLKKLMSSTYMGGGFLRLLNLAITLANDKIVLVDEIENGLHYTVHIPLIEFIFDTVKKLKRQVFITTHSEEFLEKFIYVMKKNEDISVSAYRCFRQEESMGVNIYSEEELGLKEQLNIELR